MNRISNNHERYIFLNLNYPREHIKKVFDIKLFLNLIAYKSYKVMHPILKLINSDTLQLKKNTLTINIQNMLKKIVVLK